MKRITKQWLDGYLVCKGGTYPALLMYQELADMACNRITTGITRKFVGERPIQAVLAELCRVAESHPRVRAYVKNHNLGLEVQMIETYTGRLGPE